MVLIGLGHKARNGKGEFANAIKDGFGKHYDIRIYSFATALRREVMEAATEAYDAIHGRCPENPDEGHLAMDALCYKWDIEFDENAPRDTMYPWGKQRKFLQWYGTDFKRKLYGDDYWAKRAMATIDLDHPDVAIIDDMRFFNEFDAIGERGGLRVKLSRLGYVSDVPQHVSETALDDAPFDLHLGIKDGNLPLLHSMARGFFNAVVEPQLYKKKHRLPLMQFPV